MMKEFLAYTIIRFASVRRTYMPKSLLESAKHRLAILFLFLLCVLEVTFAQNAGLRGDLVYVGTYSAHGGKGIYAYRFDPSSGRLISLGLAAESADPSFLVVSGNGQFLYAVNEIASYQGQPTGAVTAFKIEQDTGKLSELNEVSSRDQGPAHIALDRTGKWALVSNYTLGSVAVFPILKDGRLGEASSFVQHKGSSVNPERQAGPHAHSTTLSPDDRFAIVADLGLDELIIYPFDKTNGKLGSPHVVKVHPGAGPRHLTFDPTGRFIYLINEMQSAIVAYRYEAASGGLTEIQTISTLPKEFTGKNTDAEIEIDRSGKFLYASDRGADSIAVFAVDSATGILQKVEDVATQGKTPRNFTIDSTGKWLLVANQDSDNIVVFRINDKTGALMATDQTAQIPSPVCIVFDPKP
jgi:6-phosphogluconolactonase